MYIHKFSSIYTSYSLISSSSTDDYDDDVVHTRKKARKKNKFENPLMIIMITAFFIPFHNYLHTYLSGILLLYKDTYDE